MNTSQILYEEWQPEPTKNLVESRPVQEGTKLSITAELKKISDCSWEDLRGFSWVLTEEQ